jgi:pSer/pThr/pTyr-binding forkhead associated (FHA) protein
MAELWLKFLDEYGETRRVLAEQEEFTVGRHSENNLILANHRLSRRHIKIERFADVFVVSDCESSNGTTLNGAELRSDPVELRNGDLLILGDDLEIEIEIASVATNASGDENNPVANLNEDAAADQAAGVSGVSSASSASAAGGVSAPASAASSGSISTVFYFIAPAFVMLILLCGGLFFIFRGRGEKEISKRNSGDFIYSKETPEETPKDSKDKNSNKTPQSSPSNSTVNSANSQTAEPTGSQTPIASSSDIEKVKQNSASFMRRIAQNDQNPFLTQEQARLVNEKIKAVKGASGLSENIKAVKRDAAQFESLANSKNLKPQFLAAAALTKGGNPTETAKEMLPVLSELKVKLDNKLADDNLLIIAAFDQGKAGKFGSLSGKIEGLAKTSTSVSPRQIRTIWFLKEKGKITDAEFDFALRFLAIGTIMQNPADFGVQTDAVTF